MRRKHLWSKWMADCATRLVSFALAVCFLFSRTAWAEPLVGPYDKQVRENIERLREGPVPARAAAAERLGFLRAYSAEPVLIEHLTDRDVEVRRQAALALAWCGGRRAVEPLLRALSDDDWVTRQSAHVALTNLTGMVFPFNALAGEALRAAQAETWRRWWASVPADGPPSEVVELATAMRRAASGWRVTASTAYKGPPEVLTDGQLGPVYWQTKDVRPPQWCTVDFGATREISRVVVHQYGPGFCMTEYELTTSLDGVQFERVRREKGVTPTQLVIDFALRPARYVRITSFGSQRAAYPTTFYEIEVPSSGTAAASETETSEWRAERGLRALGALGGGGAAEAVLAAIGDSPPASPSWRPATRAGIKALGRLHEELAFQRLLTLLNDAMWARVAAEALGDYGDARAVAPLLAAYPRYAKRLDGSNPTALPADDRMSFPSEDRMLETSYAISLALCRLPLEGSSNLAALREIAPLLLANQPNDHDTFILYQTEASHLVTRHLLDRSGRRQEACEHAFEVLDQPRRVPKPEDAAVWPVFPAYWTAAWLPCICTDRADLPRLVALLDHPEGYVRINAAKALAWLGDRRAIVPLAQRLSETKAEAEFGFSLVFKDEEFADPAPRCREAYIRALGLLGASDQTEPIARILDDEASVLEVRRAAADALAELGTPQALATLEKAAREHSFASIRHVARDALVARGQDIRESPAAGRNRGQDSFPSPHMAPGTDFGGRKRVLTPFPPPATAQPAADATDPGLECEAIVFVDSSNDLPNNHGTVVQADWWRETYVVTDEGPAYRPGENLSLLRPPKPDGKVTALTRFRDGYVAEPEVSWDGRQIVFARRSKDSPWWQIFRIQADGTGLVQLTNGPYHHSGPAWLPDGRIVFGTSRSGIRDEYHAYPCTALWVMDADGRNMRPLATNIGRDNEPAVLADGRVAFSRLEVFYSRNKTELTLHAMHPDGTQDVVLYGPERREFWRDLNHGPRSPADGQEAPLTHRVLRMSQPQPMANGRGVVVTTQAGLVLVGPRRGTETLLCPDYLERAYTTPYPLADGRILCAATRKRPGQAAVEIPPPEVDLGLYVLDPRSGKLALVYNNPDRAEYEARPIAARPTPSLAPQMTTPGAYGGRFLCASVFNSQEPEVRERGRLVRLIEGVPMVQRHSTQTNPWEVWKNHGGTFARVLGTAPLAADGSFFVEAPADRLLHFQVLDSNRRVVGNQRTWIYPRPGETKSCVGCHERPDSAAPARDALAAHEAPLDFLPNGLEFAYRAKAWFKGSLPSEIEERTRTVHAVNLLGR